MTKSEKDEILKKLAEDRNNYVKDCDRRIANENGKVTGADYMIQRFVELVYNEEGKED